MEDNKKYVPFKRRTWCKFCRKNIGFVKEAGRWNPYDLMPGTYYADKKHKCDPADVQRVKDEAIRYAPYM